MSENILDKIIKKKIEKIDLLKKTISSELLIKEIDKNKSFINFKEKIQNNINNNKISIIAEIKKASPSAGILIEEYNPIEIAEIYDKNKATLAISSGLAILFNAVLATVFSIIS